MEFRPRGALSGNAQYPVDGSPFSTTLKNTVPNGRLDAQFGSGNPGPMDFDELPSVADLGGRFDGDLQGRKSDDHAFEEVLISPTIATKRLRDVGVDRFGGNTQGTVYPSDNIVLVLRGTPVHVPVTKRERFKRMKAAIDAREVATHALFSTLHASNSMTAASTVAQAVIQFSDIADEINTHDPTATFALCIGNVCTVRTVDCCDVPRLVDPVLFEYLSKNVAPYNSPDASQMSGMASQRLSVFPWLVGLSENEYKIVYIPVIDITGEVAREIVECMTETWDGWNVGSDAVRVNLNQVFQLGQLIISKTNTDSTWRLDVSLATFAS